jgi:5,10-methylenetetrahydromethanopterin reductase
MRIHFILEPDSPERFRQLGLLAEELGFDAVGAPNILQARDPFLAFAPLARDSRRIRLGPVAVSPFELHPAKMANALLTLNELAGGRANLTVGGGGGAMIAMHLKPDRQSVHPRMVPAVRECVEFLRRAATGEVVDFAGEVFQVEGYRAPWAGSLPPPRLYLAANRPRMLRLAGRLADGVMLSDISLNHLPATLGELDAGLAEAGRRRDTFPVNNLIAWHVKPDREAAFLEARRKLWVRGIWERARLEPYISSKDCDLVAGSLPALAGAYARGEDPSPTAVPRALMDALADGLTLVGSHADLPRLLDRLRAFRDAGVTELSLRLYGEPEDSIRLVAERVVPALEP